MSQSARVESTQALETLHEALAKFGVAAQAALGSAATEIQRTLNWLDQQGKFWRTERDRRHEAFNRARAELTARRWSSDRGNSRGATEQELEFEKARKRLAEAEAKIEAVRRWQRLLPEAIKEYEGPARQLAGMIESDLRQSLAILDSKVAALAEYAALTVPVAAGLQPADSAAAVESAGCKPAATEQSETEGEPA
jgi:hypothetical protein